MGDPTRKATRSSVVDSVKGCGLTSSIHHINKEELRRRILIPEYLRRHLRRAIHDKQHVVAGVVGGGDDDVSVEDDDDVECPECPMVVFVNVKSGGRYGREIQLRLMELMSDEQVFDLSIVKPHEFVQYGLARLEQLAIGGDSCAKKTREKLKVVVAGGDGTVGWVLGCLGVLHKQDRLPVPPVAIIPLGTGNDLSRSFGWGGSFPFAWKSAVKRTLSRACTGPIARLDSWQATVTAPAGEALELPHSLKSTEESPIDQELVIQGRLPEKVACYEGVFYNYFSIGMDAQVAYGFHHLRNEKPYLAQGPISNKLIYSGYSCTQGWFFTPCVSDPGLRGLKNILKLYIKKVNSAEWEQIRIPSSVRSIVALNLHNYGSGRHPWGNLSSEYMEKRGFVEANADDGLLEIFGLKHGWHGAFVMVQLITAKHIAQAAAIRFEFKGGEWKQGYLQMDGEPWKQPFDKDYSTLVEIKRVPHQSLVIRGG